MWRNQDGSVLRTGATSLEPQSINTVTLLISPAPARSPSWLTLIMLANKSHYSISHTTVTHVAPHLLVTWWKTHKKASTGKNWEKTLTINLHNELDTLPRSGTMGSLRQNDEPQPQGGVLFGYLPTCLRGTDSPCGCLEWLHAIKMNCSSSVFMTWRKCVVRGNIAEMVNRDRCICLLLMGASNATMLMSSSVADSGHLLGGKSLLSICICIWCMCICTHANIGWH